MTQQQHARGRGGGGGGRGQKKQKKNMWFVSLSVLLLAGRLSEYVHGGEWHADRWAARMLGLKQATAASTLPNYAPSHANDRGGGFENVQEKGEINNDAQH
jgi:hypothetical protein